MRIAGLRYEAAAVTDAVAFLQVLHASGLACSVIVGCQIPMGDAVLRKVRRAAVRS